MVFRLKSDLFPIMSKEGVLLAWIAIETVFDPFIRRCLQVQRPGLSEETLQNLERDLHFLTRADLLMQWLTGFSFRDGISQEFWQRFVASRNKRNDLTHRGAEAESPDTQAALEVAEEVVAQIYRLTNTL